MNFEALWREADEREKREADSQQQVRLQCNGEFVGIGEIDDAGGYVVPREGIADLYVPVSRLTVDEETLRAKANLDTHPTKNEIADTRRHLLDTMLEAERFPYALIRASGAVSSQDSADLTISLTLHGSTGTLHAPATVVAVGHGINVSGTLSFNLTDFGITPYSVLGGALSVRDRVDLQFDIRALRCGIAPRDVP